MPSIEQRQKAQALLELHSSDQILVLPNVWDPIGARVLETKGYPAVATASSAISSSLGFRDGEQVSSQTMLDVVSRISRAVGAPRSGARGRAFPTAQTMAAADEGFYRDVVRAGYRGPYMQQIARVVAAGSLDLEALGRASPSELTDDDLEARLLALPGVGPNAAAHIMFLMGRYSRLILDSWTRPKYARLVGRSAVKDATIQKRFRRYGDYAGLAFWMFLTRDWVDDELAVTLPR